MFKKAFTYDWTAEQILWQSLLDLPLDLHTRSEWMAQWDRAERRYAEQKARLHWASMADVASPEPLEAYQQFNKEVVPQVMQLQKQVYGRWLDFNALHPQPGWEVTNAYLEHLRQEQELAPDLLQQEDALIMGFYNTSGFEKPVPAPYSSVEDIELAMQSADREERRQAWDAWQHYMVPTRAHRTAVFLELIQLRKALARRLGLKDPLELAWKRLKRHGFSPADWQVTRQAVIERAPALLQHMSRVLADLLDLPEFTTIDLDHPRMSKISDRYSKQDLSGLHEGLQQMYRAFYPRMADLYQQLLEAGTLDLEYRHSKTTQAFADLFPVTGHAGIMGQIAPDASMFGMLNHELGHAVHFQDTMDRHHMLQTEPSAKFMEFVAHVFEICGHHHAAHTGLFDAENLYVLRARSLYGIAEGMLRCALIDQWEEWAYTQSPDDVTVQDLHEKWHELAHEKMASRFVPAEQGAYVWSNGWHVRVPFGMARYATADMCSLEFMGLLLQDASAFERLDQAMQMGDTRSVLELFQVCGLKFDFSERAVERSLQQFEHLAKLWNVPMPEPEVPA